MKPIAKAIACISLSLMCLFACVGYAALTNNLSISGDASLDPPEPEDVYITDVTPSSSAGVEVTGYYGTVFTAKISEAGTATFTISVINISDRIYLYDRVIDGAEVDLDGVYNGTEITYKVTGIAQSDEVACYGGTRSFQLEINVPEEVTTDNYFLKFNFVEKFATPGQEEFPEEMPDEEITLAQRLADILNNRYRTEVVTNSRNYLINETIQVRWDQWSPPYVGSMDQNYATQIDELFGDILIDTNVSFILKNEDLNGDWINEIALYSTSDTLDSTAAWGSDGVVCVYVTVFTPEIDEYWNITGYKLVCESIRGYCYEVRYGTEDLTPSFSTDEWRTDVGYMERWDNETNKPVLMPIPDDTMNADGTKLYKLDYNAYNLWYQGYKTAPYGGTMREWLDGKIPPLY